MHELAKPSVKKPYSPPRLTVYGTVRDLTQMVSNHGNNDMPSGMNHKTGM